MDELPGILSDYDGASMTPSLIVAAGVLERDDHVLAAKRMRGSHLEGHWEFPGGKLEPGESPEECLERELREELGILVEPRRVLDVVFHRYPERSVLLLFYRCRLREGVPRALECDEVLWVPRVELGALRWAPADLDFVRRLAEGAYDHAR